MKRYKFLISFFSLLLIVVFLFSFSVSAAETYEYSLKELIDAGQLSTTIYSVPFGGGSESSLTVTSNTTHWSNAVRMYLPSSSSAGFIYSVEVYSNQNTLFSFVPTDSVLSFKTGRFVFVSPGFEGYSGSTPPSSVARMRIGFRVLMDDGTFKYVYCPWMNSSSFLSNEPSFLQPAFEFSPINFQYNLPDSSRSIYSIFFEFDFNARDGFFENVSPYGTSYFMMWGGKAEFFVGPLSNAPIYSPPDTGTYDDYHSMEDNLLGSNEANKDQVDSFLEDFGTITPPSSQRFSILKALSFWQTIINDNIKSNFVFNEIIVYVLSIGLVVFILSTGIVKGITHNKGG